jgi:hypothetical protein
METLRRFEIRLGVSEREPAPRRAFGMMVLITCAVAAVSFAWGLAR